MRTFLTAWSKTVRVFFICGTVSLCLSAAAFGDDVQSRIDEYFKDKIASSDVRVQVLFSRKDQPLMRGVYGGRGLTRASGSHGANSIFPIGLISEQFVAAAVLRLEEQGKIKLDRSLCDYLSQCPKTWSGVKIIHLLSHTSGLPLPDRAFTSGDQSSSPHSVKSVLAHFDPTSMSLKPGTNYRYNALDFVIVNVILREVSRQPPQKYIDTQLFYRQKIFSTGCCDSEKATSTVEDLYRWNIALAESKVISRNSLNQMLTPYRDGYSLGWRMIKEFDRRLALQIGETEGVSVCVRMYPDDGSFIIVVAQGLGVYAAPLSHDIAAIAFGRNYSLSRGF